MSRCYKHEFFKCQSLKIEFSQPKKEKLWNRLFISGTILFLILKAVIKRITKKIVWLKIYIEYFTMYVHILNSYMPEDFF